ncbi:response regulator receiver protein [[Leptolyngbya] sp. PCC 7376]|uniref:response regulator n=1 Tax=[Leptolyngbya] sp. PCC 7376 TaxID=111781 RepID=UPI00029F43B0|nr:response regulator [[Leptolyngbya] sp. PCC 7376]AFY36766.1 response regulator receiver protein [[Leptolyngbya] sp. PCC 7376]
MDKLLKSPLLVVEDNDEDFTVLMEFLGDMNIQQPIYRCKDGDDALDFLSYKGAYTNKQLIPQPSVVLLDLNLPGTDGREVLEQLKEDENFKKMPIVIFTTSSNPQDIDFCYRHGANGYLVKPINFEQMRITVQAFVDFWLNANTLPQVV